MNKFVIYGRKAEAQRLRRRNRINLPSQVHYMLTVDDVVSALSKCKDPELDANIVEIGLIQGIRITGGKNVRVKLTMTSPMCPVISLILADVQLRLKDIIGEGEVEVELSWDPMWNPEMMDDNLKYRF
ncbi:MAG: iron-sulfur cluster assembly protein [Candidatus Marsarchaeota archaeon]|nr:iron-sulfur cluster assembly protein [Candidatus Marsarchaeota archaeon]